MYRPQCARNVFLSIVIYFGLIYVLCVCCILYIYQAMYNTFISHYEWKGVGVWEEELTNYYV